MNVGIDLVHLPEFSSRLSHPGMAENIFTAQELRQNLRPENLAGVFAAKEAFFKAWGRKLDWQEVEIEKLESGQPVLHSVYLAGREAAVSISHSGDYITAIVILS